VEYWENFDFGYDFSVKGLIEAYSPSIAEAIYQFLNCYGLFAII
jgi:hypothetical protein